MPFLIVCNGAGRTSSRILLRIGPGVFLLCVSLFFILGASPAFAHKVSIFAYVENGTIYTESYFPDGKPAVNGRVEVYNSEGQLIQEGRTDEDGNFKFKIPAIEDLTIVLDASMGHRAEYSMKSDELAGEKTSGAAVGQITGQGEPDSKSAGLQEVDPHLTSGDLTAEDIRKMVREELAGQIEPIRRSVIDLEKKEKVSVHDIFSGIGYILGLMGTALFVYSIRRKKALKDDQ